MAKYMIHCSGPSGSRVAEGKDLSDAFRSLGYTNFKVWKNVITSNAVQRGHETKYYGEEIIK